MGGLFLAPLAKLPKFNLLFHFFLILAAPVVDALAGAAGQLDESVLGHMFKSRHYIRMDTLCQFFCDSVIILVWKHPKYPLLSHKTLISC